MANRTIALPEQLVKEAEALSLQPQVVAEIEEGKDKPDRVQILCFLEGKNVSVEEVEVVDVLPKEEKALSRRG